MKHILFDEIIHKSKATSTMKIAESYIRNQTKFGNFLVVADEQSGGRGRGKNIWHSPAGGLWMTAALQNLNVGANLTLFVGVCIRRALALTAPDVLLKWPNDIYYGNRKLSGILTNALTHHHYHVIGIGINTNVENFPPELNAISLSKITGKPVDNEAVTISIFDQVAAELPNYIQNGLMPYIEDFRSHHLLNGKVVTLDTGFQEFTGQVKGVSSKGALLMELKDGMIQPFFSGTIIAVR
ncbi:MAG: biotin--[acetyl-CoA-carboxylase] ligase [Candidatus Cloacimonetes bacterium]|nr:biotin--[acetyl-CoA-carboxylase] ligase [Candidatus Cloacimonadota bacterium]